MILINKLKTKEARIIKFEDLVDDFFDKVQPAQVKRLKKKLFKGRPSLLINRKKKIEFINVLIRDHSDLIKGTPSKLQNKIEEYELNGFNQLLFDQTANKGKGAQTSFGELIEILFGYGPFRNSTHAVWLAEQLNIRACPYCNAQYILSYSKSDKPSFIERLFPKKERELERAMFEYDHFFPKSRYPYLSTSIYNLIPACKPCNLSKSNIPTDLVNYVHPYHRDFNSMFEFDCSDKDVVDFLLSKKKFSAIEVQINNRKNSNFDTVLKNHIELFDLDKIYQMHKDIIEELYLKSYYYNKTRQTELLKMKIHGTNENLFSEEMLARFILGNYALDSDINNRPLAKMTKDIAEKIELLDFLKKS